MDFSSSPRAAEFTKAVRSFIRDEVAPVEHELHRWQGEVRRAGGGVDLWQVPQEVREPQRKARAQGLWNLFLPAGHEGPYAERFGTRGGTGLTNVDYAPIAEATGWSFLAPYVFNCNAPDSGNAEVLLRYGSQEQKDRWSGDFPLAGAWTAARAVRLADGPDEVHKSVVARIELGKHGAVR
jgi:acyl-CoA dehydrogenase